MKSIPFFVLIPAIILLAGCGFGDSEIQVTDPQLTIQISTGEEFTIILEANPTAGYQCKIIRGVDKTVIRFARSDYKSTSDPNLVLDLWIFKAISDGEIQVTLGYYPPSNSPVTRNKQQLSLL